MFSFFQRDPCITNATFGRLLSKDDANRIKDVWTEYCSANNLSLPAKCVSELKKRITGASNPPGGKSKLVFSYAELDDKHLKYLLRVMALAPCIASLDLSGNSISVKVAEVIVKLLNGQINLVRTVPVDSRLDASFLTKVNLSHSSQPIREDVLAEISRLTSVLTWANAEAHIRKIYWAEGAPEALGEKFVNHMWELIIGKITTESMTCMSNAFVANGSSKERVLQYKDLQEMLFKALVAKQLLPPLSANQRAELTSEVFQPTATPVAAGGKDFASLPSETVNANAAKSAGGNSASENAKGQQKASNSAGGSGAAGAGSNGTRNSVSGKDKDKDRSPQNKVGSGNGAADLDAIGGKDSKGAGADSSSKPSSVNTAGKGNSATAGSGASKLGLLFGHVEPQSSGANSSQRDKNSSSLTIDVGQSANTNASDSHSHSTTTTAAKVLAGAAQKISHAVDMIAKNKAGAGKTRRASMGGYLPTVAEVSDTNAPSGASASASSASAVLKPQVGGTSEAQRSSGYGHSSPSMTSARRRTSQMFANPVLEASPEVSPFIQMAAANTAAGAAFDPEPQDSAESGLSGAGKGKASTASTSATSQMSHISKNIQLIKELQQAKEKTHLPANLLLKQKRRESLMEAAAASRSTGQMVPGGSENGSSSSHDSKKQQISRMNSAPAGMGTGGSGTNPNSNYNSSSHFSSGSYSHGKGGTDMYGLPTVDSPSGGAGMLLLEEEDEDDDEDDDDDTDKARQETSAAAATASSSGVAEEKGGERSRGTNPSGNDESSSRKMNGARAQGYGAANDDNRNTTSSKNSGADRKKLGRMTMLEGLVKDMYRPIQSEASQYAEELAKKRAREEREAKLALERAKAQEEASALKVLDFANYDMESLDLGKIGVLSSPRAYENIKVLILRSNKLFDMNELRLSQLTRLTDLDLGSNRLVGPLPRGCIPPTVERLDMSYNQITDIAEMIHVSALQVLNIKNNSVRGPISLPPSIQTLDLSFNNLRNILSLRLLSLSPNLVTLSIAGNPVTQMHVDIKSVVSSMLPSVLTLDGAIQPGGKVRKSDVKGLKSKNTGGTLDPVKTIALNRSNNSAKTGRESHNVISPPSSPPAKSDKKPLTLYTKPEHGGPSAPNSPRRPFWEGDAKHAATGFKKHAKAGAPSASDYSESAAAAAALNLSRREQVELDRTRMARYILKREELHAAQEEAERKLLEENEKYAKKLPSKDVSNLLHRLTHNGRRADRDPTFHQKFLRSPAGKALAYNRPFPKDDANASTSSISATSLPAPPVKQTVTEFEAERAREEHAAGVLEAWITDRVADLGKASIALSSLFTLASAGTPTHAGGSADGEAVSKLKHSLEKFQTKLEHVSFLRAIDLPADVSAALEVFTSKGDNSARVLVETATCIEHMAMMTSVLLDLQSLAREVVKGPYSLSQASLLLQQGVDDIMSSENGKQVNDVILMEYGCKYVKPGAGEGTSAGNKQSRAALATGGSSAYSDGGDFSGDLQALVQSTMSPIATTKTPSASKPSSGKPSGSGSSSSSGNSASVAAVTAKLDDQAVSKKVDAVKMRLEAKAAQASTDADLAAFKSQLSSSSSSSSAPTSTASATQSGATNRKVDGSSASASNASALVNSARRTSETPKAAADADFAASSSARPAAAAVAVATAESSSRFSSSEESTFTVSTASAASVRRSKHADSVEGVGLPKPPPVSTVPAPAPALAPAHDVDSGLLTSAAADLSSSLDALLANSAATAAVATMDSFDFTPSTGAAAAKFDFTPSTGAAAAKPLLEAWESSTHNEVAETAATATATTASDAGAAESSYEADFGMSAYDRHLSKLYGGGGSGGGVSRSSDTTTAESTGGGSSSSPRVDESSSAQTAAAASAQQDSAQVASNAAVGDDSKAATVKDPAAAVVTEASTADQDGGGTTPGKLSAKDRIKARLEAKRQAKEA